MKRFYKTVTVGEVAGSEVAGSWQVLLDGRPIRTAAKAPQVVPSRALAEALAAEWAAQGEEIDPATFPLRDLADYAIDIAMADPATAAQAIMRFAESDTLCYRADAGEALHARQAEVWEPLVTSAERRWDVHFTRVSGIIHLPQPAATLARLDAVVASLDPFALAALQTLASLAASLIVGLAALEPEADGEALWQASELEELWQAELWGSDAEAEARQDARFAIFRTAMEFARLARAE